jgi:hypothetical protein
VHHRRRPRGEDRVVVAAGDGHTIFKVLLDLFRRHGFESLPRTDPLPQSRETRFFEQRRQRGSHQNEICAGTVVRLRGRERFERLKALGPELERILDENANARIGGAHLADELPPGL